MKQVKIYTSPGCAYCMLAKQLFTSLEVPFEEKNLAADPAAAEALSEEYNWRTVPMIFIGDEFVGGYDDVAAMQQRGELESKFT